MRRILWIDDEFDFDNPLVRLLAFEGFRTEVAASGAEGLVKAQAGSYDGIVLDLRLPDIFGLSVLTRLVAHDDAQPVLVVTGYYHEPEMEREAMAAGAAAFRHKPLIDIEDLAAVLHSMVDRLAQSEAVVQRSVPASVVVIAQPEVVETAALSVRTSSRRARIFAVSRKLADPSVASVEFVTTARMLRRMLKGRRASDRPIDALPREVRAVIHHLELKVQSGCVLRESDLETELGIHPGDAGQLLALHTGAGYREWRRALRLRPALPALASSDEPFSRSRSASATNTRRSSTAISTRSSA